MLVSTTNPAELTLQVPLAQGKNQNVLITLNPIELPVQGEAIFVF